MLTPPNQSHTTHVNIMAFQTNICIGNSVIFSVQGQFRSLQPTDVIGKEFSSVEDVESFYSNYSKVIGFSTIKDEMRRDSQGVITRRRWVCSKQGYRAQKDVLAFDATYKTNVYRISLVIFVGVNHHKSTTIFGFGLLGDETVETYTWLLRTFSVSMHGKMPQSVVTDGDKAMHKAIKTVMPNSVRRLCCWHLEPNVQTNIQDQNFT
ncbi:hypothetical protein Ddye_015250 [Dipteronia dyeriana]|uniref:MULE transposase domain-containing protein n=1 Tax=Dipteronia dyeriana TaxID=168575 RepID=A0AAD9WYB8_9ROSI|nr:hypothetical protein Ddye_015250 [Dipteronia dyeriana]